MTLLSIPNIVKGKKESFSNPIHSFDIDRRVSTYDRSLYIWESPPDTIIQLMTNLGGRLSGSWVYENGDYQGWHTNSSPLGQRVYLSWASEEKKSGMKFILNEKIVDSPDYQGWNLRAFTPPIWHCVYSECLRASIGFMFNEPLCEDLILSKRVVYVEDLVRVA